MNIIQVRALVQVVVSEWAWIYYEYFPRASCWGISMGTGMVISSSNAAMQCSWLSPHFSNELTNLTSCPRLSVSPRGLPTCAQTVSISGNAPALLHVVNAPALLHVTCMRLSWTINNFHALICCWLGTWWPSLVHNLSWCTSNVYRSCYAKGKCW